MMGDDWYWDGAPRPSDGMEPDEALRRGCIHAAIGIVATLAGLLLCALLLGACCTCKDIQTTTRDSIRTETSFVTVYVPDTVFVEIPAQTAERTTADSMSHLENDYATSDAVIRADGTLFHTLATKASKMAVETEKKIEHRDSIQIRYETITKLVEKKLSRWERFKMDTGLAFIAATLMLMIYSLYLLFLKRK